MKALLTTILATLGLSFLGCGKSDCSSAGAGVASKSCSKDTSSGAGSTTSVTFNGYVQRAFTITVNKQSFNDTEDLYTNFIDKLITSDDKYKTALAGAKVDVEGDYGITTFGSSAPVAMSSMAATGDIFNATTDSSGKFSISVTKTQQGQTFKAKVITRIGLQITYPTKTVDHWCYLLFGQKDNINIGDAGSSVIFDSFTTQLNTYNCSKVNVSALIIPTSGTNPGVIASAGNPDSTTTTNGSGSTTTNPYIKIAKSWTIASPLAANESGTNSIQGLGYSSADKSLFMIKNQVTSKSDGSVYLPAITLTGGFDTPQLTTNSLPCSDSDCRIYSVAKLSGSFVTINRSNNPLVYSYDSSWQHPQMLSTCIPGGNAVSCSLFADSSGLKVLGIDTYAAQLRYQVCSLNPSAATILTGCSKEPDSNKVHPGPEIASLGAYTYSLSTPSDAATLLSVFNSALVDQKKSYVISKLDISVDDLKNGHLFSDGSDLYFASLAADKLTVRKLQLVEQ